MTVFTPLLIERCPEALHIGRAILDFVILARYRSYDSETLRYIAASLAHIDILKEVFREYRLRAKTIDKGYFNFPKFHNISHLVEII